MSVHPNFQKHFKHFQHVLKMWCACSICLSPPRLLASDDAPASKNTKGKGKLNKSKKKFWFEKDFVSPEDISLSNSYSDSSHNEMTKDSFDTKSSKESSPTSYISDERRASFFENPLFNNNGDSDHQSPQHKKPKWDEQLLKDVHSDEMNKTGTRRSSREEANFSSCLH
jgi:hypothetical protein